MFFFVWRGYGMLGLIPPILGLVALGFLSEQGVRMAFLGAGAAIALSGIPLAIVGWRLNRNGNFHSLYGIPLWFWAGMEALLGLVLAGWIGLMVARYGWKGDIVERPVPMTPTRLVSAR